jgi:acyl-CoA thioester hydrolase
LAEAPVISRLVPESSPNGPNGKHGPPIQNQIFYPRLLNGSVTAERRFREILWIGAESRGLAARGPHPIMALLLREKSMPTLPYAPYRDTVAPEWIDYNGHMNVAYYVLAFDRATDRLFDYLGVGQTYRQATHHSIFALEAHVTYEHELHQGETFEIATQLIDADRKRLHVFHAMTRAADGALASTMEVMGLHVDMAGPRSAPLPDDVYAKVEALRAEHRLLPRPPQLGRQIGIRRS